MIVHRVTADVGTITPQNVGGQYKIGDVLIDNERGMGNMEFNSEIAYFGFVGFIKPRDFFKVAAVSGDQHERGKDIEKQTQDTGRGFANPILTLGRPGDPNPLSPPWDDVHIVGHEGRARMTIIRRSVGEVYVPVHMHVRFLKARNLDEDLFRHISTVGVHPEGIRSITWPLDMPRVFWQGREIKL